MKTDEVLKETSMLLELVGKKFVETIEVLDGTSGVLKEINEALAKGMRCCAQQRR